MASTIYDSLLRLSREDLDELYFNEWCALAVFQSLDVLSRVVIMRFVFQNEAVFSYELLDQFVQPTGQCKEAMRTAVERLKSLRIFGEPKSTAAPLAGYDMNGAREQEPLVMNENFRASLQKAISAAGNAPWEAVTSTLPPLRSAPSAVEVEQARASFTGLRDVLCAWICVARQPPLSPTYCCTRRANGTRSFTS